VSFEVHLAPLLSMRKQNGEICHVGSRTGKGTTGEAREKSVAPLTVSALPKPLKEQGVFACMFVARGFLSAAAADAAPAVEKEAPLRQTARSHCPRFAGPVAWPRG